MRSNLITVSQSNAVFMSKVYYWMMLALAISGTVALYIGSSPALVSKIFSNSFAWVMLIILQFGAVIALSAFINRMNTAVAVFVYVGYAALTGVTFSTLLMAYTQQSIAEAFFVTAFGFVGLSAFGYITKRDLGPLGSFCGIGLFGLIGFMLVAWLFPSIQTNAVSMTINVLGIMIFAGLTAYDTQAIKSFNMTGAPQDVVRKAAICGALKLYLDFINMFLMVLSLFGDRR